MRKRLQVLLIKWLSASIISRVACGLVFFFVVFKRSSVFKIDRIHCSSKGEIRDILHLIYTWMANASVVAGR